MDLAFDYIVNRIIIPTDKDVILLYMKGKYILLMRLISHCSLTLVPAEVKSHSPKRQDTHTLTHRVSPHPTRLSPLLLQQINVATLLKYHQSFKVHLQCSIVHCPLTSQTGFFP